MRRNRLLLERGIETALDAIAKARAHYALGLFHDNNGREATAIPHYEAALRLGLDGQTQARCLAWLASSLYKTGRLSEAMERIEEALPFADPELRRWLVRLRGRINRGMVRSR